MLAGHQQDPQRLAVTVAAGLGVVGGGQDGTGGQARIGRIGLATRATAHPFGSAGFHHVLPAGQQHAQQPGAVRAAATPAPP